VRGRPAQLTSQVCRFGFPRVPAEPPAPPFPLEPEVLTNARGRTSYEPVRNDGALVVYSPLVTLAVGANSAMVPATDVNSMANYVAKDVSIPA
jgi:hypothetical protein